MFSLALLGQSEASKYVAGMADTDATIRGHVHTLITSLVAAGIWSKLEYLGVIQNLQADTQRCLKRRTSSFSWSGMTYLANNGLTASMNTGFISSGFDPHVDASVLTDDSHTFGSLLTEAPPTSDFDFSPFGRWDLATSVDNISLNYLTWSSGPGWGVQNFALRYSAANYAVGASLNNGSLVFGGRQNSTTMFAGQGVGTTGRTSASVTKVGTFSAWVSGSDKNMYHGNRNTGTGPASDANLFSEIGAWFGAAYLTDAETDALATALNTYLTARGAI